MADIPDFFSKFVPEVVEPPAASEYVKKQKPSPEARPRTSFTFRDWEFLAHLTEFPDASNGKLSEVFGVGRAAASARIKRLAKLGLISVAYEHSEDTGDVNKRSVTVLSVPDRPWIPEGF